MMITQKAIPNVFQGIKPLDFAEMVVLPLTRAIFNLLPAPIKAPGWVRNLAFRMALKRAYASFAAYYPQWTASLFDDYFLKHGVASLLVGYRRDGSLPQPIELAGTWEAQLGPASISVRERRIAELTPVAADFLDWLAVELAISPFS
jgi:hypothetical protein